MDDACRGREDERVSSLAKNPKRLEQWVGPGTRFFQSSDSFSRLCFLSRHLFRSVFSEHPLFSPVTFTSCFIGDTTTTPLRVDVEANALGKGSNAGGT